MKVDKSMEEVWEWKEELYKEIKGLSPEEINKFFNKVTENYKKKGGLKEYSPISSKAT